LRAAGHFCGEDKPLGLLLLERAVHENRAILASRPSRGEHADALLSVVQIESVGAAPERGVFVEIRDAPTDRDTVPIEAIRFHQKLAQRGGDGLRRSGGADQREKQQDPRGAEGSTVPDDAPSIDHCGD